MRSPKVGKMVDKIQIVVGTYEHAVFGLEMQSKDLLMPYFANEHITGMPKCVKSNRSGRVLVCGFDDDLIRVYNLDLLIEVGVLDRHRGTITGLEFIQNDNVVLSSSEDGTVGIWRVADWNFLGELKLSEEVSKRKSEEDIAASIANKHGMMSIAVHPSEKLALSITRNDSMVVWDLIQVKCVSISPLKYKTNNGLIRWVGSSKYVIPSQTFLNVYDLQGKLLEKLNNNSKILSVVSLVKDEDSRLHIATGSEDGRIRVWDLTKMKCVFESEEHQFESGEAENSRRVRMLDVFWKKSGDMIICMANTSGLVQVSEFLWDNESEKYEQKVLAEYHSKMRITCMDIITHERNKRKRNKNKEEVVEEDESSEEFVAEDEKQKKKEKKKKKAEFEIVEVDQVNDKKLKISI